MLGKSTVIAQSPQINLSRPTQSRMWLVNCCAVLGIIQSALTDRGASLAVASAAVITAVCIELLMNLRTKKNTLKDGSTLATALIFTLMMPNQIHPMVVVFGVAFAIIVIKYCFGGLGANWLNPAVGGWLFVRLSWPVIFSEALGNTPLFIINDALARNISDPQGSPLAILKMAGFTGSSLDTSLTSMLNTSLLRFTGAKLPDGYIDLFIQGGPGVIADRGLLALLVGSIILTASQISRFWVPAFFLGVYALFVRVFGAVPYGGSIGNGDVLFGLLSGGIIVTAFILLADPATGPKSAVGAAAASIFAGCFTFVFRYQGMAPYGGFFSIALLNALIPLLRGLESHYFYETRRNS